jgi:hypothetical protein
LRYISAISTLYVGGNFTATFSGDVSFSRVARWNTSTNTWSALSSGLNGVCYDLQIDPSNNLYATGDFTVAGGTNVNRLGKWNGTSWTNIGNGLNNIGYVLSVSSNTTLFAGGSFNIAGDQNVNNLTRIDQNYSTNITGSFLFNGTNYSTMTLGNYGTTVNLNWLPISKWALINNRSDVTLA